MNSTLQKGLEELSISIKKDESEKMEKYLEDILFYNPTLKLVGERCEEEIVIRNFLDTLSMYNIFKENVKKDENVLDLGSGAGFPGLLLSILFNSTNFTLVERMKRRAGFLKSEVALLSLKNVKVIEKDTSEIKGSYSLLLSRAFHSVLDTLDSSFHLGSRYLMYKGKKENIDREAEECEPFFSFEKKVIPLSVPFLNEERNVLLLDNVKKK